MASLVKVLSLVASIAFTELLLLPSTQGSTDVPTTPTTPAATTPSSEETFINTNARAASSSSNAPVWETLVTDVSSTAEDRLSRRMGVIGPFSTVDPPRFEPGDNALLDTAVDHTPSGSQIREQLLKVRTHLPLSPHSPHNVFSVHDSIDSISLFRAEERLSRGDTERGDNEIDLSSTDDLNLKLKAISKAQEATDRPEHHILDDGSIQCDKFITAEEFYIRSPNYPYNYPSNVTCEFQVYRRDASVCGVELTVLRFDMAPGDPREGCGDRFSVLGRPFCGRRQRGDTALILFPGLLISMKLETGPGYGASGVLLQGRQVTNCRQTRDLSRPIGINPQCVKSVRGNRFTLRSPGYPASYPHNSECWYHIHRRSEKHCGVELVLDSFVLEAASCMFDYLESAQKRICGRKAAGTKYYFPFESEKLSIRFRSDESITRSGFLITGRQVECKDAKGLENSYEDPKTLEDFLSATAARNEYVLSGTISRPTKLKDVIEFDDDDDLNYILALTRVPLPLENEKPSRQHLGRELGIVDDVQALYDLNDIELVAVTETLVEEVVTDYNPFLVVGGLGVGVALNETDSTATVPTVTIEVEPINTTPANIIGVPTPTLTLIGENTDSLHGQLGPCDEVYSGDSFTLRSPKVTEDSPKKIDCSFFIKRSSSDVCEIRVVLLDVSLKRKSSSGSCAGEYLQIAATRFCGGDENQRVRVRSPGPLIRILLHSDDAGSDTGFTARVQQLRGDQCNADDVSAVIPSSMNCDVTITRERTTLLSPHYPNKYPHNLNCLFKVQKSSQDVQSITLHLEEFELEHSYECRNDFFSVGSARVCGRRSGDRISYNFPANELEMVFRTDDLRSARGYRIHVSQNRFRAPQQFGQRPPLGGTSYTQRPPTDAIGITFPTTFRPPPPGPTSYPNSLYGSIFGVTTPSVGGPTPHTTLTECGGSSNSRVLSIKSPGYPGRPPADLHCVYNIKKSSLDICQLKLEIQDLQISSRTECGRSYLQVGSQQRICRARREKDIRTYHFTEDVMQLIFHTDSKGQDGGLHIIVYQLPCGNFEPIGTFSGLQTATGVDILTGNAIEAGSVLLDLSPPKESSIEIIHTSNVIDTGFSSQSGSDKNYINANFGTADSYTHYNGQDYNNHPTVHVKPVPETKPQVEDPSDCHYLYYYVPEGTYQGRPGYAPAPDQSKVSKGKGDKGGFDFMSMIQEKFDKIKSVFNKGDKGNGKGKGEASVEVEFEYNRPRPTVRPRAPRRPLIQVQTPRPIQRPQNRPIRYVFVRNPYYRPNDEKHSNSVRFRYPQVYTTTERPVVRQPTFQRYRYPNAYIVVPTSELQQVEIDEEAQASFYTVSSPRPEVSTQQPVYVNAPRPIYFRPPRPILVNTPRPVIRITTPRPVATPPRPILTNTRVPYTSATVYFPRVPLVRVPITRRPPLRGYNAFIITTARPEFGDRPEQVFSSFTDNGLAEIDLISSASVQSSVTTRPCGRVIRDEEFYIRGGGTGHNSITHNSCTYIIAKSDSGKCSLVLEVQDFQQPHCAHGRCNRPAVHMLTSFSPHGELRLQFNETVSSGASFVLKGRQLPCTTASVESVAPITIGARPPLPITIGARPPLPITIGARPPLPLTIGARPPHQHWHTVTSAQVGDGWTATNPPNWVGPGGRQKGKGGIFDMGSKGVKEMKAAFKQAFRG